MVKNIDVRMPDIRVHLVQAVKLPQRLKNLCVRLGAQTGALCSIRISALEVFESRRARERDRNTCGRPLKV